MQCVVTGAGGFIGSHLCERLLALGHHVTGIDAFIPYYPLASGLLTGKYRNGIPAGSRAQLEGYDWLQQQVLDTKKNEIVGKLEGVAKELGATVGQLALAWVLTNPHVSTVITGSSRIEQLHENLKSAELSKRITPEIKKQIEDIVGDNYE